MKGTRPQQQRPITKGNPSSMHLKTTSIVNADMALAATLFAL